MRPAHLLNPRVWLLVILAVPALLISRMLVQFVPFRRVAPMLGYVNSVTTKEKNSDYLKVRQISAILQKLSRLLPWRCLCFEQALAGMMLLRASKLAGTIYFGVCRTHDTMEAHAWLRSGDFIVTGAAGHQRFTVLFTVASVLRERGEMDNQKTEVPTS